GPALPRRLGPPLAARNLAPGRSRSASNSPSASRTRVPTGTGRVRPSPSAPLRLLPCPCAPRLARWGGWEGAPARGAPPTRRATPPAPPPAAAPAVGPAPRLVLLAVERGHPVAAAAGGHLDGGLVDEHRGSPPRGGRPGARVD